MKNSAKMSFGIAFFIFVLTLSILAFAQPADAALQSTGPVNHSTGYPDWYTDSTGQALGLCLDQNGLCILPPEFDPAVTNPPAVIGAVGPGTFPDETFYWIADSSMNVGIAGTTQAKLRLALEGAFTTANGVATPNKQMVFLRVNLQRINGLTPNSVYTVTHPFGSFQFSTDANGNTIGAHAYRAEDGSFVAGEYVALLPAANTNIGPFLKWDPAVAPLAPAGYVGDPAVRHTLVGGLNANAAGNGFFRIEGPNIGGAGINTVETDLFTLSGKLIDIIPPATQVAPVFDPIFPQTVQVGNPITFTARATDANNDVLAYSLGANAPAGMSINSATGSISWNPSTAGIFSFDVHATDGAAAATGAATVIVTPLPAPGAAGLKAVGPVNPSDNFPMWYQDSNSLALDQCLAGADGLADPMCVLPTIPPLEPNYNPAQAISFPTNYPSESFYWIADSDALAVGAAQTGRARFRMALESAFATGTPAANQQIAFLRLNLPPVQGLVPGATYTITHPFGSFQITADAAGATQGTAPRFRVEDGSFIPGEFAGVLPAAGTKIGPFLKWDPAVAPLAPAGYVGNPAVSHVVSGGLNSNAAGHNFVRIEGPDIGGPGINSVETDQFFVAGKIHVNSPPVLASIPNQTATPGALVSFTATATDPNLDAITFSLGATAPAGAAIGATTGVFTFTPTAVGTSTFSVVATDAFGGAATSPVTITVIGPTLDTTPPVITMLGSSPINIQVGSAYTDANATALDDVDGDLTLFIVATSNVNTDIAGSYTVVYTVSDAAGNSATATRAVNVVAAAPVDGVAPVITVIGTNSVDVVQGSLYADASATALDNVNGDLTASIVATSNVNTDIAGSYTVVYTVSDAAGNSATATRVVNVVAAPLADTFAPVITLLGTNPADVMQRLAYADAGAIAIDNVDGNITANILVVNNVDTAVVGQYAVTYNVSDAAGNAAAQVVRTVNVVAAPNVAQLPVNLGTAGNFVILAKSGISTTGTTSIVGNIGVSPIDSTAITGFGLILDASNQFATSALVTGNVYAADYAAPTPASMTQAISDMETAYTDAAGRTLPDYTELGAGNIGGMTLAPGLYKWGAGVTIPTDVTLFGNSTDVWVFQIAGDLSISPAKQVILSGGAQAKNIFWQVAGQTTLGTTSVFNGNILGQTAIAIGTGATLNGRALAQTAVTLDANNVAVPAEIITDTVQPVITIIGTNPATVNQNTSYTDAGATALDNADGAVAVATAGTVDTAIIGTYTLTYTASDAAGNVATAVRLVNVVAAPLADTFAPVITLLGTNPVDVVKGSVYADAGATAIDNVNGNLTASVVTSSNVNIAVAGVYSVTYNVSDAAGNTATATRTVNVILVPTVDTTPPNITLLGANPVGVGVGSTYTDAGATALDNVNGDLTASIITTSNVNTAIEGTYTVTYNATDTAGNIASTTRTVHVVAAPPADNAAPQITMNGKNPFNIELGKEYKDAGAKATDSVDGNVAVQTAGLPINTSIPGTVTVTYTSTDSAGNIATAIRTVNIIPQAIKNKLEFLEEPVNESKSVLFVKQPVVKVIDQYRNVVTNATDLITISAYSDSNCTIAAHPLTGTTAINAVSGIASYNDLAYGWDAVIHLKAESAGLSSTCSNAVMIGVPLDDEPPVITMLGASSVIVRVGELYVDAGATALDDRDGSLTASIATASNVNTAVAGTYAVTYTVADAAGNAATATRAVKVDTPPAIAQIQSVVTNSPVTFSVMAIDADGDTVSYSLVNAPAGAAIDSATGAFAWTPAIDGVYNFDVIVSDGLTTTTAPVSITADLLPPITWDDYNVENDVWQSLNQSVTLTPSHGTSGQSWTKYCFGNGCDPSTGTDYTGPVSISTDGITYFRYASKDLAGNIQTTKERVIKIDRNSHTNNSVEVRDDKLARVVEEDVELEINSTLNQTVALSVRKLATASNTSSVGLPALNKYVEITSPSLQGVMAGTLIKVHYTDAELSSAGIDEATLRLFYHNETSGAWERSPDSGVDTSNNIVWALTDHFSTWGAFGSAASAPADSGGQGGGGGSTITNIITSNSNSGGSGSGGVVHAPVQPSEQQKKALAPSKPAEEETRKTEATKEEAVKAPESGLGAITGMAVSEQATGKTSLKNVAAIIMVLAIGGLVIAAVVRTRRK